ALETSSRCLINKRFSSSIFLSSSATLDTILLILLLISSQFSTIGIFLVASSILVGILPKSLTNNFLLADNWRLNSSILLPLFSISFFNSSILLLFSDVVI